MVLVNVLVLIQAVSQNYAGSSSSDLCYIKWVHYQVLLSKLDSNTLSDDAKAVLATVASRLRNNPECKVVVIGYCSSSKKEQQLSWDHVNAVITYLVEKEGVKC